MMAPASHSDDIRELAGALSDCFLYEPGLEGVPESLFLRHLGMPDSVEMDDAFGEHSHRAREWFASYANPWATANVLPVERIEEEHVILTDGIGFKSDVLVDGFRSTEVCAVVVAGISAGAEVDIEIDRLWKAEQPDDAMFLSAYAIAVVEHLRERGWRALADAAAQSGLLALPHYSPGYEGWRLEDQGTLFSCLADKGPITVLESSGLRPEKSTLVAFGVSGRFDMAESVASGDFWDRQSRSAAVARHRPEYGFARKTLKKWSRDRLTLTADSSGRLAAKFRVSGSTCANMGLPLAFDYSVDLEPEPGGGHRIRNCRCEPSGTNTNHQSTCLYLSKPKVMLAEMKTKPALEGALIDDALHWNPDVSPAGCLCLQSSRDHKWRVVFQTIHFALCEDANCIVQSLAKT